MFRSRLAIFLGAFLLFQVEPICARFILPWFGGSPSVWTTCLLFFQAFLLVGYAYAHVLSEKLSPRAQAIVHAIVAAATLLTLPILPSPAWKPTGDELPGPRILLLLLVTVGAPYTFLSATGPLVQAWFVRSFPGRSPYRLYAASNAGSLLALLTYPIVVEPLLRIRTQATVWSLGYVVSGGLIVACAFLAAREATRRGAGVLPGEPPPEEPKPALARLMAWILLPALASALLVATTNQLCQDIAVVPFLWIVPLALYFLTLVLCFEGDRWYRPRIFTALLAICVPVAAVLVRQEERSLWAQIGVFSATLFAACMCCHGELVKRRPGTRYLTLFYLCVAAGGALGGAFVAVLAPLIFSDFHEYLIGLAAILYVSLDAFAKNAARAQGGERSVVLRFAPALLILGLGGAFAVRSFAEVGECVEQTRSFFGILRVSRGGNDVQHRPFLTLESGQTTHGLQFRDMPWRRAGTTYYGPSSGGALAIRFHPKRLAGESRPLEIGALGLGIGTLATYAQAGDELRFYELDPKDVDLARRHFSYLSDSKGQVEVVTGDARVNLERELRDGRGPKFDVLVLDCFSGDSIAVHLLTQEAGGVYLERLAPGGLLAIHITNRFLDLTPVVRALAASLGLEAGYFTDKGDPNLGTYDSYWVVLAREHAFFEAPPVRAALAPWPANAPAPLLWTDDWSSVWRVLR